MHTESARIKNFINGKFVEPPGFLVIPSEVACQAVALCEGLEESLYIPGCSLL